MQPKTQSGQLMETMPLVNLIRTFESSPQDRIEVRIIHQGIPKCINIYARDIEYELERFTRSQSQKQEV